MVRVLILFLFVCLFCVFILFVFVELPHFVLFRNAFEVLIFSASVLSGFRFFFKILFTISCCCNLI